MTLAEILEEDRKAIQAAITAEESATALINSFKARLQEAIDKTKADFGLTDEQMAEFSQLHAALDEVTAPLAAAVAENLPA